jgi:hypothetical protein
LIAPATMAGRRAQKEAAAFAATVKPGKTYYSIVDCNWPWGRGRLLQEFVFTEPSFFSGGQPMCEHLSAAGVWLSCGPIHASRPAGLETLAEYRKRPEFPPNAERALRDARPVPAGV